MFDLAFREGFPLPYLTSSVDQNSNRVISGKLSELDQSLLKSLFTLDRVAAE